MKLRGNYRGKLLEGKDDLGLSPLSASALAPTFKKLPEPDPEPAPT